MEKQISARVLSRMERIKEVALQLFLSKGYEATSLNEIIKKSGGSYSSIYDHFKNKEGLFLCIVSDQIERHLKLFDSIKYDEKSSLEDFLLDFSRTYLQIFNEETTVKILKIIHSQIFHLRGIMQDWAKEKDYLFPDSIVVERFKREKNAYLSSHAKKLADLFCYMIKEPSSKNHFNDTTMSKQEQEEHIRFCVDFFLRKLDD